MFENLRKDVIDSKGKFVDKNKFTEVLLEEDGLKVTINYDPEETNYSQYYCYLVYNRLESYDYACNVDTIIQCAIHTINIMERIISNPKKYDEKHLTRNQNLIKEVLTEALGLN